MFGGKDKQPVCPLLGGKPCLGEGCMFWVKLRGNHPQTGASIDEADCTYRWLPILMIENTQKTNEVGAAVESFRNEMERQNGQLWTSLARPQTTEPSMPAPIIGPRF